MNNRRAETAVPIALWLCAAAVVHFFSYDAVEKVAAIGLDRMELRSFAQSIHGALQPERTLEVAFLDADGNEIPPEASPEVPPPPAPAQPNQPPPKDAKPPEEKKKAEPPPEKKPEPPKVAPKDPATPVPPPPPPDKKVAIKQHSEPDPKDNPDAKYAADQARHVEVETQAKLTNHEKDDKDPTPGGQHTSASKEPGNEEKTKVAESDDKAGEQRKAPGEASKTDQSAERSATAKLDAPKEADPKQPSSTKPGEAGVAGARTPRPTAAALPVPAQGAVAQAPETITAPKGWSLSPRKADNPSPNPAGATSVASPSPTTTASPQPYAIPKLGGGPGPNGINFSLTPGGALAAVGERTLEHLREADGERRRSAHRGSWHPPSIEKWRSAIENYVASVKQGNQTALNAARVPFASYLNTIHNKLHPIFADAFLDSLDSLPANHQLNGAHLHTDLEVVVDKDSGKIVKMGVVHTSGVTAFDVAALEAMERSSPFGKADPSIVSGDGRVYLHWEFHRQREIACGTINARPFKLKGEPEGPARPVPPARGPRVPEDPREPG
jgi:hypothetical protein